MGDSINNSTIVSSRNQFHYDQPSTDHIISAYCGEGQRNSGPSQSNSHTNIRMETAKTSFTPTLPTLELQTSNRRLCISNKQPTTDVLEPVPVMTLV
ncbi:unnamed protein product [Absidia cylindrospora]